MGPRHRKNRAPPSAPNLSRSYRSAISLGSLESLDPPTSTTSEKKRSRILSGLHPSQDIIGGISLPWESQDSASPNPPPPSTRYTTRGTLNGFQPGIYDNRYHPMDKILRPKASAKRERRLKAQSKSTANSETEQSDGGHECIVLSSGSGSDVEVTDADADAEESPINPSRRFVSTRRSQRARRVESSTKPLYNSRKHPLDDLLEDSDHPPKLVKKLRATRSSGTIHPDTPLGSKPLGLAAKGKTATTPLALELEGAPSFPEVSPTSMQETIQRVMALVKEANQLIPLFPALNAHLQKAQQTPIQVYEDHGALERTKPQSSVPVLDDFEKENIRGASPTRNAASDLSSNNGPDLGTQHDEQGMHGSETRQQSEDIDHPRRRSSTHLMPPPRPQTSSTTLLQSSAQHRVTGGQRQQDPPSTGTTPVHTQNDDVPPSEVVPSWKVMTSGDNDACWERTIKDTHLTVSQSEALESSQIGTQFTQVTLPPSDEAAHSD